MKKNRALDTVPSIYEPGRLFIVRPHELSAYQLPPLAGFVFAVSCAWVLPAPAFSPPLQAVEHPVTPNPAPARRPAMLRPATNFFKFFFSMPNPSLAVFSWFPSRNEGCPNRIIGHNLNNPFNLYKYTRIQAKSQAFLKFSISNLIFHP
jgi:hypothetical protein